MPPVLPPGSHLSSREHERAARIRFRRAITLMVMTLVLPGSAQLDAGNRKVGRIALRVVVLLVGLVGLLLERHLLVGVLGVPPVDQWLCHPAVVLALHIRDGTAAVETVGCVTATGCGAAPATAATGGEREGENAGGSDRQ